MIIYRSYFSVTYNLNPVYYIMHTINLFTFENRRFFFKYCFAFDKSVSSKELSAVYADFSCWECVCVCVFVEGMKMS